jgi:hypothetical protein
MAPEAMPPTRLRHSRCASGPAACDKELPDGKTTVGSKEYYRGFLETPLEDVRGDGMEQALKLGAGTVGVVVALMLAFLASNGLL